VSGIGRIIEQLSPDGPTVGCFFAAVLPEEAQKGQSRRDWLIATVGPRPLRPKSEVKSGYWHPMAFAIAAGRDAEQHLPQLAMARRQVAVGHMSFGNFP
jgi:hypothetical protein